MKSLNETDIKVLETIVRWHMVGEDSNSIANGAKAEYIQENIGKSVSRVRNSLKLLIEYGYIKEGIKQGLKKTYVMTKEGMDFLSYVRKSIV